jgi:hypothetical protein
VTRRSGHPVLAGSTHQRRPRRTPRTGHGEWRAEIQHFLTQAREAGEIYTDLCDEQIIGHLLAALLGAQITASLLPSLDATQTPLTQLDGYLDSLNPPF